MLQIMITCRRRWARETKILARPQIKMIVRSTNLSLRTVKNDFAVGWPSLLKYKTLMKSPTFPGVIIPK